MPFIQRYQVLDLNAFSIVRPLICKTLLRLYRDSGLYPRCFALFGLEKIGQQVAAGGFGDIWKGMIRGRSVCVKIMRLFQDADISKDKNQEQQRKSHDIAQCTKCRVRLVRLLRKQSNFGLT
jgi:hypothetical protein